jgi:hypothetical protein
MIMLQIIVMFAEAAVYAATTFPKTSPSASVDILPARSVIIGGALDYFKNYPNITSLLCDDLSTLSLHSYDSIIPWPLLEILFEPVSQSGLLTELEAVWVDKLRLEDVEVKFDFHYMAV